MRTLLITAAALTLAGCAQPRPLVDWNINTEGETNAWSVRMINDRQRDAAIVAQRTIFAHHFVTGSATLNERGERDLAVLAHNLRGADQINITVTQGDASDDLFNRRTTLVRDRFAAEGVNTAMLTINDGFAGGGSTPGARAAADYARPSEQDPHNLHKGPDTK
jgi:type IV pilus biogenesis protein CpaD/CtpE